MQSKAFTALRPAARKVKRFRTSNYERGRTFEYRVRDEWKAKGYTVKRSYASKGVQDLRCTKRSNIQYHPYTVDLQCKTRLDGSIGIDEAETMRFLNKANADGTKAYVVWRGTAAQRWQIFYKALN